MPADQYGQPHFNIHSIKILDTGVIQYNWTKQFTGITPVGLHLTPDGCIATVSGGGIVYVLNRSNGNTLTTYDIATTLGGLQPNTNLETGENNRSFLKTLIACYIARQLQEVVQNITPAQVQAMFSTVFGTGSCLVQNTIAAASSGPTKVNGVNNTQLFITVQSAYNQNQPASGTILLVLNLNTNSSGTKTLSYAWRAKLTAAGTTTSPSISPNGKYASVGDTDAKVYLLDVNKCNNGYSNPTGAACPEIWNYGLQGKSINGNYPIDDSGTIYVWQKSEVPSVPEVIALGYDTAKPSTPKVKWTFNADAYPELGSHITWSSQLTLMNNILLGGITNFSLDPAVDMTHKFLAIDRNTGALRWNVPIVNDINLSPVVVKDMTGQTNGFYVPMFGIYELMIPGYSQYVGGVNRYNF